MNLLGRFASCGRFLRHHAHYVWLCVYIYIFSKTLLFQLFLFDLALPFQMFRFKHQTILNLDPSLNQTPLL